MGNENCPGCISASECYAECDQGDKKEFDDIASWEKCKEQCRSLGRDWTYEFGTMNDDRACAMYFPNYHGKCVCVKGDQMSCQNIHFGNNNCPNCLSAPACLAECDSDHTVEFTDIANWEQCQVKCKRQGGDFAYEFDTFDPLDPLFTMHPNKACAIYAEYDNKGNQGLCRCVEGNHNACDNTAPDDAYVPPVMRPEIPAEIPHSMPVSEIGARAISSEMVQGYEIGVISTVIILVIALIIACIRGKWRSVSGGYMKVNYEDSEVTEGVDLIQ